MTQVIVAAALVVVAVAVSRAGGLGLEPCTSASGREMLVGAGSMTAPSGSAAPVSHGPCPPTICSASLRISSAGGSAPPEPGTPPGTFQS